MINSTREWDWMDDLSQNELITKITEGELYLTRKSIHSDNTYQPSTGDEDQPLRDELDTLRKKVANFKIE